jgi:hypothetical protein
VINYGICPNSLLYFLAQNTSRRISAPCVGNIREQKFVSKECNISELRALAQRLAILSCILEVPGSNLDTYSNYHVVVLAFT